MNRLIKKAIAMLGLLAGITLFGAPNVQAAETIPIDPTTLPRGAITRLPHLEGNEIVDGATRIPFEGTSMTLIGKTPYGYIISSYVPDTGPRYPEWEFTLVTPTTRKRIGGAVHPTTELSSDGKLMAFTSFTPDDTYMYVLEVGTGKYLAKGAFEGQRALYGVEGQSVFLSDRNYLLRWNYATGQIRATDHVPLIDAKHHLSAGTDANGCTALRRGQDPKPIWSSCTERIVAFNQTGKTFATRVDRDGQTVIRMRGLGGALQATFPVTGRDVGKVTFESPGTLLLDLSWRADKSYRTVVRAWRTGANRATAIETVQ